MLRVAVLGTGLIGGSIGLALTKSGAHVLGYDANADTLERALAIGAVTEAAETLDTVLRDVDLAVVALPVGRVADVVIDALDAGAPVVTDVGSAKSSIVHTVESARPGLAARFVGGHPMAGSEQDGLDGANAELFVGATWVLTPTSSTDASAHTAVRALVASLGAEIVEVTPEHHDALVAIVSHVPQLAATTLMDVAATSGEEHATLLRLAAGGFRDMTRIAAGHPGIWPDICVANRDAIVEALDQYLASLVQVRELVAGGDGEKLLDVLERARAARRSLPKGAALEGPLVELRVPVPDRPGVLAEITTLAGRLGVNIADLELAHSMEGDAGVLVMIVAESGVDTFERRLQEAGYTVARELDRVTLSAEFVVEGGRPLRGALRVPGCKGISHRALLLAALADGRSRVSGLADGADVASTASALAALGVKVKRSSDGATAVMSGGADTFREPASVVNCGNSGTTMRMVAGVLAGCDLHAVLVGDESLSERPMRRVVQPLRVLGAQIDGRASATLAPLSIRGGHLRGVDVELEVASGQVKSAVIFAGLRADGTTTVSEPSPSRDHTERMLAALGVPVSRSSDRSVSVSRGAPEPFELHVPGDPSSAAFYVVAASLISGSSIVIEGVSLNPARIAYLEVLREMGAAIETRVDGETVGEPFGAIAVESTALHGTEIRSTEAMVDELPALAIAAAFAEGTTTIADAAELRVKESDRIATLQQELAQLGIEVTATGDGLVVHGGAPRGAVIKSHGDHRIALAGAVAGLAATGTTTVRGWRAIAVSYPEFERDLAGLLGEA